MESAQAENGQPRPGIWQLAWPAILANLLMSMSQFINIKIVGSLGAEAVAAVTTGGRIFFITQAVMMAISAGTVALVARAWGAEKYDEANAITRTSLALAGVLSLFISLPGILMPDALAHIFDLDEKTLELAGDYIFWISFFNFSYVMHIVLGAALRAAGDTLTPLWMGGATNVITVILVYPLVFGGFGIPALGVSGAAISAGIAFCLSSILMFVLLVKGKFKVNLGKAGDITKERLKRLFHIGMPSGVEQAIFQVGFLVFLLIVAKYGTAPYAAYGIGVNLLSFSFVVGFGFSIAGSTLAGQYLGAKDPAGAMAAGWRTMSLSMGLMFILGLIIISIAEPLASFMIDDPEVIRLTVIFIYILGAVQPLMAIEHSIGGALRGSGDTRFPLYCTMTGLIGARVTLSLLFYYLDMNVVWIYAALIFDYIVKAIMLIYRFRSGVWQRVLN